MNESVILVDIKGATTGTMDKLAAHRMGKLHRAFSVFIFNSKGELLLQQRAIGKYHSGGLWSNTCCSHPRLGENTMEAASRRLNEEMGIACGLREVFSFHYFADLENGLAEHEFDHVFFGFTDDLPVLNCNEVNSFAYISIGDLAKEINLNPDSYTEWLKICLDKVVEHYKITKCYDSLAD